MSEGFGICRVVREAGGFGEGWFENFMSEWVIGHKNPDTDAICSALGYADLLSKTSMPGIRAARCGDVNARTSFVLDRAGVAAPALIMDVRPQAGQIGRRSVVLAEETESLLEALNRLRGAKLRSMPVVNLERKVIGMLSLQKAVELLLPQTAPGVGARLVSSSLARICRSLQGTFQHQVEVDREEVLLLSVGAMRADAFGERVRQYDPRQLLLVVGNRTTVQSAAIEYGVRALIITGGFSLDAELLEKAKASGTSVICTLHETASTTLLIKTALRITEAMDPNFLTFDEKTLVKQILEKIQKTSQTLFPILDERGILAGVFSKSDLIDPPKTRLVLVDHNELSQAVTGAAEADIVEVIDHHRIGGTLVSQQPIRFLNEPVGSTCTIVARQFRQAGLSPDRSIALLLAAGIISDTLFLKSPTTTAVDREVLEWLEKISGEDLAAFAADFFNAGSALKVSSADEVVAMDCKEYEENGWKIEVAQVEELGLELFWTRKNDLAAALQRKREETRADLVALLITDITQHYSLLMVCGEKALIQGLGYPRKEVNLFSLEGVVSRKKQLLPELMRVLLNTTRE